jgi:hypothetical protein
MAESNAMRGSRRGTVLVKSAPSPRSNPLRVTEMSRVAVLRRSFPTLASVFRGIGKRRRLVLCLGFALLGIVACAPIWWLIQLAGLPDIGEPFDVAAFKASTIPEHRNAFVLYRQASNLLKPATGYLNATVRRVDPRATWSKADPGLRRRVEENRAALAVYRRGAQRSDARFDPYDDDRSSSGVGQALISFLPMSLLEGSRLEEEGDLAGAWGWYGAMLRTIHHLGMVGSPDSRRNIQSLHPALRDRLKSWSADPRTTREQLTRALDDVIACETLAPSERDSLKIGYLDANRLLNAENNPGRSVPNARFQLLWNSKFLEPRQIQSIWDGWRFWRRERERSQRLIRLVAANWLAWQEIPAGRRPKPDPNVSVFDFYALGPKSPSGARAVSPAALGRWFDSAIDAPKILGFLDSSQTRAIEQTNHAELVMLLTTELYRRDHGADPPQTEDGRRKAEDR